MRSTSPRDQVAELERTRRRLPGDGERFRGYGVLGLPFTLGHVLAFRRGTASSIGPPFTSVWHRSPEGRWTFYVDVEPSRCCPRYFGAALSGVVRAQIDLTWTGPGTLAVSVPQQHLEWALRLESRPATGLLGVAATFLPPSTLRADALLSRLGPAAGRLLKAGPLRLAGQVPNGQRFRLRPRRVWCVAASAAMVGGRDLGPLGPLPRQPAVGGFPLPNRGLFVIGDEWFESYDPAWHRAPPAPDGGRAERARGGAPASDALLG